MNVGDIAYHPRFGDVEIISIDTDNFCKPVVVFTVKNAIECIPAGCPVRQPLADLLPATPRKI